MSLQRRKRKKRQLVCETACDAHASNQHTRPQAKSAPLTTADFSLNHRRNARVLIVHFKHHLGYQVAQLGVRLDCLHECHLCGAVVDVQLDGLHDFNNGRERESTPALPSCASNKPAMHYPLSAHQKVARFHKLLQPLHRVVDCADIAAHRNIVELRSRGAW